MIKYPLASSSWDKKEFDAIQEVIESGNFSMGEKTKKFEKDFSNYFGAKHAVMVNSGSSANLISIAALFFKKDFPLSAGDEVIVPSVSWSTTFFPLQQYGLKLKFVDIDLQTLNLNIKKLKKAITDKTRLIVAVNLLGNPNEFNEIIKEASSKKIYIIEDNCESLGAKYNNKYTGTFGICGTFSPYFSHHISTMEGGVIVTNVEELYQIYLSLRAHGWTRNLEKNNLISNKSDDKFYESFRFILPGYNVRPLELEAAIGIEQLKKVPTFIKARRENAKIFQHYFKNDDRFIIQKEIGKSSWFGFSLIINPLEKSLKRDEVVNILNQAGIESRPIVSGNFTKNEVIKYFNYEIFEDLKNSDIVHNNGFFIGNHHFDLKGKIRELRKLLNEI